MDTVPLTPTLFATSEGSRMFSKLLFAVHVTFRPEGNVLQLLSQGLCNNNLKS
jgi:hypothetical protein